MPRRRLPRSTRPLKAIPSRVAIAPLAGGDVIDKPLPADQAALYQLLGETP